MSDINNSVVSYWRKGEPLQNFGDFISDFLVRHLFYPYRSNARAVHIIGSVISDQFASFDDDLPVVFWGCGLREDHPLREDLRPRTEILSARGPLTVSALKAGGLMPIGDPGFLMPALYTSNRIEQLAGKSVCIPHFHDGRPDRKLLELSGCDLVLRPNIENREPALLQLIDAITSADFVLSASLHGCVVAAAYGRPFAYWNPGEIDLPFKWEDLSASLSIPCIFATDIADGRRVYESSIAPTMRIPDLSRSLARSPLLLRGSALVKILSWQERTANAPRVTALSEILADVDEMGERQRKIYDGIIDELRYWSKRAVEAEVALASEKEARERLDQEIEILTEQIVCVTDATAQEFQARLDQANSETLALSTEVRGVRDELTQWILTSAKFEGQVYTLAAQYEHKATQYEEAAANLQSLQGRISEQQEQLENEVARASHFENAHRTTSGEIEERCSEIENLNRALNDHKKKEDIYHVQNDWMQRIQVQLMDPPWWWGFLPRRWQRFRLHERLKSEGLFDAQTYLARYPDVATSGMDPLRHYIAHGRAEGRSGVPFGFTSPGPQPLVVPVKQDQPLSEREYSYPEIPIRPGEKRIMIIDSTYPTPDRDSGSVDAVNFIKIFSELGYSVYFIATANFQRIGLDGVSAEARKNLEAMSVGVIDDRYGPNIAEVLQMKGGYFELFFLSRVYAGGIFFETIRSHAPKSRVIFNTVDLHGIREMREGELEGDRLKILGAWRTSEREQYLARLADATIVVSAEEARILADRVPGANVFEIPLLRDIPGTSADLSDRNNLGFIGGYKHKPNIDAAHYFLDAIWPLVRRKLPDAQFHLMGADMPDELRERTDPGLVIVGQVKDLQAAFDSLRLTVAPLRVGAGAKGKVVSSLSHGLPCVATPIAAEGMKLDVGVLVAGTPEQFAKDVVRLCTDDDLWHLLSEKGLELVEQRHSSKAGVNFIQVLLQSVGQKF